MPKREEFTVCHHGPAPLPCAGRLSDGAKVHWLHLWNGSLLCCRERVRTVPSYGEVLLSWCSLHHCCRTRDPCLSLPKPLLSPGKQGWAGPQQQLFGSQVPIGDPFPKPWHSLACAVVTNTASWQYRAAHRWLMPHMAVGHFHRGEYKSKSPARALPCSWKAQRHLGKGFISAEHPTYGSNQCPKYWQPPRKVTGRATLQSVKALKKKKKKFFMFSISEKRIRPLLFRKLTSGTLMRIL